MNLALVPLTKENDAVAIGVFPFLILASIAVCAAVAMITSRNAIHAALFLVINLGTIAIFFLTLNAPLLAMVQVAVYAGAIMVLFLFVIMLLGAERLGDEGRLYWQQPLAIVLAITLSIEAGYLILVRLGSESQLGEASVDSGPRAVGEFLFGNYLLPFELTSVLLLAAMIGALALTLDKREHHK